MTTTPPLPRLVTLAATLVLCVGCGTPGHRTHLTPTATATQSPSPPGLPFAGAPTVTDPLPRSVLSGDPCTDALTPTQVVAALGAQITGKREDLAQVGPACGWFNPDTGGAVGVSYTLNIHTGLSAEYANTQPKSALWKELPPIQGFPAIAHAGTKATGIPIGFCQASIGLADDLSIDVSLTLGASKRDTADACGLVSQIADMAVTTLRERAPMTS
ncbi:DUF3558 domain-containing protein [Amycolatopsis sp. cg9]|uniref:DUF3558 domain-containing protein n=1 Tax=Amycolatopsis sp. cg9 TaxID=3238801 RepID=UPI0035247AEC